MSKAKPTHRWALATIDDLVERLSASSTTIRWQNDEIRAISDRLTAAEDARDMFQRGLATTIIERDTAFNRLAAAESLLREACEKWDDNGEFCNVPWSDWLKRAKEVCGE